MKILHVALNNLRQTALCDALASLGEYREIDWISILNHRGKPGLRAELLRQAEEFRPDVIFMQLQTPDIIDSDTLSRLPGFKINWTGDVRQPLPDWYINLGADLTLFTNTADVEAMRSKGLNADYLQTGFDPAIFNKGEKEEEKVFDIVFMGNNYGQMFPLSRHRYEMVHALKDKYGQRFHLFGSNWDIPCQNLMYRQQDECHVYRRTKIAINLSHFDLPRYSSDRIQRIMGSGAFCLSHYFNGLFKEYRPARDMDIWIDIPSLLDMIDFYLVREEQREAIARAGYELAHSRDTWAHRIKELTSLINKYYGKEAIIG